MTEADRPGRTGRVGIEGPADRNPTVASTIVVADTPPADWDARTVDVPGGHVLQSRAWAEHQAAVGWRPRYATLGDGTSALALTLAWPLVGGAGAYVPRGPNPRGTAGEVAARVAAVGAWLEAHGVDAVAVDPEVPANAGLGARLADLGYHPIEELQPSRHRITLPLAGADEAAVRSGLAKSTRQRIARAERDATIVVRHDARAAEDPDGQTVAPSEPLSAALERFYGLLLETGERRGFSFGSRERALAWWLEAHRAGHLVYLEARAADAGGDVLGGLILYRHGQRLSTVNSGDSAATRRGHPGTMHLLRWRAIGLAMHEGRDEMDLGGADVAGARREPREGDPTYGLYQHKLGFGGTWLELTGAHERVARPWRYAAGRVTGRIARLLGRDA